MKPRGETSFPLLRGVILLLLQCIVMYKRFTPLISHTRKIPHVTHQVHEEGLALINYNSVSVLLTPPTPCSTISTLDIRKSKTMNINFSKSPTGWLSALLIISGDLEVNPGPRTRTAKPKYPCGICSRACTDKQDAIQCDTCDIWSHRKCLKMPISLYKANQNPDYSWHCCNCGMPTFDSDLFNSLEIPISHSHEDPDHQQSHLTSKGTTPSPQHHQPHPTSPTLQHFQPHHSSTPTRNRKKNHCKKDCCTRNTPTSNSYRLIPDNNPASPKKTGTTRLNHTLSCLIANFQSLKNKIHIFSTHVSVASPDIIFGTETWLPEKMGNTELELPNHNIFRNDRAGGWGGAMLCIKANLLKAPRSSKAK